MCRKNKLWGWILIAFGAGLLLGLCVSSQFLQCCLGFGGAVLGFFILYRK